MVMVKRIDGADAKHALEISRTESGSFRFTELCWTPSKDDVDRMVHGDGYWSIGVLSGLYASAEEAEKDASAELAWLHNGAER